MAAKSVFYGGEVKKNDDKRAVTDPSSSSECKMCILIIPGKDRFVKASLKKILDYLSFFRYSLSMEVATDLEFGTTEPSLDIMIDREKWSNVTGFKGHEGQQLLLDLDDEDIYRFFVWICGRRWGKSLLAAQWAEPKILIPGSRGWVVSKTYDLSRKVIRIIVDDIVHKFMKPGGMELDTYQKGGPILLEFPWGATVEGKSAENPESLMGEELDWVVFDEFASCKLSAWDFFLRPTLSSRMGKALFISTPKGYNWAYDLYKKGKDSDSPLWFSHQAPSWGNPYLSTEDVDEARNSQTHAAFMQEYGAQFTIYTGQVYKAFEEDVHIIPEADFILDQDWDIFRSIDFGYENPFVCLYIAVDADDRVIIYDEYVERHRTNEQHAIFLNQDERSERYEYTTCDPSGASARATLLENGIVTLGVRSMVLPGIESIRECLAIRKDDTPGLYVTSNCVHTIKEFNLYAYPETGLMTELPRKEHDHCMDALRYFVVNWRRGYIRQYSGRFS